MPKVRNQLIIIISIISWFVKHKKTFTAPFFAVADKLGKVNNNSITNCAELKNECK